MILYFDSVKQAHKFAPEPLSNPNPQKAKPGPFHHECELFTNAQATHLGIVVCTPTLSYFHEIFDIRRAKGQGFPQVNGHISGARAKFIR